jgi:hypothetical protein
VGGRKLKAGEMTAMRGDGERKQKCLNNLNSNKQRSVIKI